MKAVLFEPGHGQVVVEDLPAPARRPGCIQIVNRFSLISSGTERSRLEAARHGVIGKARERPDQAREVVRSLRERGPLQTYRLVSDRLSTPKLLGYSSAGVAVDVEARHAGDVQVGALVAAGGGGYAAHAEVVSVPGNLCVPVPPGVTAAEAAFATVGAVALQGIHQAQVDPGSRVAVIGLGLVGQLAARLLHAYSYDVIGIDRDAAMLEIARAAGVTALSRDEHTATELRRHWHGSGADAVLVCAATKNADPVELAGAVARDRATVVIVGDVLVAPQRSAYYGKELTIRYSRSYGPGRYDRRYEEEGASYPEGYVPWPLRRNMEEFLRLVARGLDLDSLSPAIYPVEEAPAAYALLDAHGPDRKVAILLSYDQPAATSPADVVEHPVPLRRPSPRAGALRLAAVGAGSFPTRMLFPHLQRLPRVRFSWIATGTGVTARHQGLRWGFEEAVGSIEHGLGLDQADCVMVLGPHAVHAAHATAVLQHGVGLFCEKPLALTEEELEAVAEAWLSSGAPAMVGFNRRFAPAVRDLKGAMEGNGPFQVVYRVFAGAVRDGHWSADGAQGGRLVGEVCHFIDTASHLIGSVPVSVYALSADGCHDPATAQSVSLHLQHGDGSSTSIVYAGRTPPGVPKELIEVAGAGFAARLDDFRSLVTFGTRGTQRRYRHGPKGHQEEMRALVGLLDGERSPPTDFTASLWSSLAACRAVEAMRRGRPLPVEPQTPALVTALSTGGQAVTEKRALTAEMSG